MADGVCQKSPSLKGLEASLKKRMASLWYISDELILLVA